MVLPLGRSTDRVAAGAPFARALRSAAPAEFLATNARLLVGLAFAFAVIWRLALSADFADGSFFRVTLLLDPRFEWLATLAGGIGPEELGALRAHLLQHVHAAAPGASGAIELPAGIEGLAVGLTAGVALPESAIAVAFLWPPRSAVSAWRGPLLLAFRMAYVGVFGLLILYGELPGREQRPDYLPAAAVSSYDGSHTGRQRAPRILTDGRRAP